MKSTEGGNDTNSLDFYLDPSLINLEIIKRIGIQKSLDSIIVEANNQTISQGISLDDFSGKTMLPLKKQLDRILTELQTAERKKIINMIITCINKNIDKITEQFKQDNSNDLKSNENNKVDNLITLALNSANIEKLFIDQYDTPHAAFRLGNNSHLEVLSIYSTKFKRYLSRLNRQNNGLSIGDSSLNTVITTLAGEADANGEVIPLYLRIAWGSEINRCKSGSIYYDMCDSLKRTIEISKDGWRIINGSDLDVPILFRKYNQKAQIDPDRNYPDDIFEQLLNLTNVKYPHQRLLLKVYIVSTLIPEIDHVILTTYGPQGAAKSFLLELIKKLIDPTKPTLLTLHRNVDQFIQQVNHNYINYYDNVKNIPSWLSVEFCKATTGTGHTKRQLYTNDEDIVYENWRPLGLNGINIALNESDALSRSLFIELEEIDEESRRKEEDLWKEFEGIKHQILGNILDILVKAMQIRPTLNLNKLPRMADFAEWGEAISQAIGYPPDLFLEAYAENRNEQNIIAVNENRVGSLLLKYIQDLEGQLGPIPEIQREPQELYNELIGFAETNNIGIGDRYFPKNASSLVKKIKTIIPNLKAAYGIIVKVGRNTTTNTSIITICRKESKLVTNNRNSSGGTESSEVIDAISPKRENKKNSGSTSNDENTDSDNSTDDDVDKNIGDRNDH